MTEARWDDKNGHSVCISWGMGVCEQRAEYPSSRLKMENQGVAI